jgi:heme O synthase-like polyprenyltransferase
MEHVWEVDKQRRSVGWPLCGFAGSGAAFEYVKPDVTSGSGLSSMCYASNCSLFHCCSFLLTILSIVLIYATSIKEQHRNNVEPSIDIALGRRSGRPSLVDSVQPLIFHAPGKPLTL